MVEVRIRHASDSKSLHLGEVPLAQVDTVIPTIESWDIAGWTNTELTGQFVYDPPSAYFEVVIGGDED